MKGIWPLNGHLAMSEDTFDCCWEMLLAPDREAKDVQHIRPRPIQNHLVHMSRVLILARAGTGQAG